MGSSGVQALTVGRGGVSSGGFQTLGPWTVILPLNTFDSLCPQYTKAGILGRLISYLDLVRH